MHGEAEFSIKQRLLHLMLALLEHPVGYTKRYLADRYRVSPDTITRDLDDLKNAGFLLRKDERNRYHFVQSRPYQKLKTLLHFSEEEQILLEEAIDQVSPHSERGKRLKEKLATIYDYHKLGHMYLRKPYLTRVDVLLQAKADKQVVKLLDYQSGNSNKISTRTVEPFHPSPNDDMLHAYDLDKQAIRHFRISRIKRVEVLDRDWQYEHRHIVMPTDPFRIVSKQQLMVHLRISVGAYNELVERYPLTKSYLEPSEQPDMFDFQGMVNDRFLGLSNFILGQYHQHVEVLEPDRLRHHLRTMVADMKF